MPNSLRCKLKKLKHQGLLTKKDCERLITALDKADKGWISVKDRLPDRDTWVLVFARQGSYMNMKVDYITRDGTWLNSVRVTHWMPLPSTEGLNET